MHNKSKKEFKISGKFKNVTKFKSKTPAQDRLQKFQKVITSNIDDCKKLLDESTVVNKPANITKSGPINIVPNEETILNNNKTFSGDKMTKISKFKINDTKRPSPVQSGLKISDKSKNVKKFKSKTSAQNRLLSIPKLISTNLNEISSTSPGAIKHRINETDSEKLVEIRKNKIHCSVDSAQKRNIDKIDKNDGQLKEPSTGFGSLFIHVKPSNVCDKKVEPIVDYSTLSYQKLESMTVEILSSTSYIVPDTNVFIHSLASIKTIIDEGSNLKKPKMFIPCVVLQELDQLKRRENTAFNAIRAIGYIYEEQKSKNPRLLGQKATMDSEHLIEVNSPDDRILNCCLQLKNQSKTVTLLTNDKNLSIKAQFNGIDTITAKKCLEIY
ncbi:transcriptional protein SWT1-like isoform X2 [Contarinia nasturtii]|uniref:transcriptional protein SWT1-like isoform X2 n=1 Tax=Contarinia nasturtii TaxID=265458 RepID=UPI0012D44E41|nr:transcriptional protein SWT1-like isoform X2 [Contarinia nasturtii]